MPKISPRARRALTEERRKQILDAATKVFAAKGFERATIADVARAAGVAEGSIYNYFKSKADLLVSIPRQVIQSPVESASAQMNALAANALPPPEQMLTMIARNMIAAIRQNAHVFRILISALPTMTQSTREKYTRQVVLYAVGMMETYFQKQIERGVFRKGLHPPTLARAFVGMFVPFVIFSEILRVESLPKPDYEQLIAANVSIFLRGALAAQSISSRPATRAQKIAIE
ncbi:MAG: TetR/AcrR family transcriptional regulator [Chloroflexi bacterium]|nr:TetR/AcrR family transcriptional regulator [Chloroflexota bacterium]